MEPKILLFYSQGGAPIPVETHMISVRSCRLYSFKVCLHIMLLFVCGSFQGICLGCPKNVLYESDAYWTVHHCDSWRINQLDVTFYFILLLIDSTRFGHYYAHHQELTTIMLITTLVVSFLVCCVLDVRCGSAAVISWLQAEACASACSPDIAPVEPHLTSNTQQTKNETTNVVIRQHSRKLLMMGILMPETCWVCKK